ncbi:hypothetical protein JYQ62_00095 [Nostoc sp. UHCC 0702]|nr:hypothetical protein JYQ62_00095 [Nostoc sp. UHCC 0702]
MTLERHLLHLVRQSQSYGEVALVLYATSFGCRQSAIAQWLWFPALAKREERAPKRASRVRVLEFHARCKGCRQRASGVVSAMSKWRSQV